MKGVFKRESGRWSAVIRRDGEKRNLGTFDTEEEAIKSKLDAEVNPHFLTTQREKLAMARSRYDETMEEINNPENYRDKIKNRCFRCKEFLINNWNHYKQYGNFCARCSGEVNLALIDKFYKKRHEIQGNSVALPPETPLHT